MGTKIPWIGWGEHIKYYAVALTEAGYDIEKFCMVRDGMSALSQNQYPLIIVQDVVENIEGIDLPSDVDKGDIFGITCGIIRIIREMPGYEKTPILVPHLSHTFEQEKYKQAGATHLYNVLRGGQSVDGLVSVVNEIIRTE